MQKRFIPALVLITYFAILVKVVVFKGLTHRAPPPPEMMPLHTRPVATQPREVILNWGANFVPFRTILPQLRGEPRWPIAIMNLVGNTVLFVPVGFLVLLVYRRTTWQKSLAVGVMVGVAMEGMEWVFHVGIVDVDDVILNACGVVAGYGVFAVLNRRRGALLLPRVTESQAYL